MYTWAGTWGRGGGAIGGGPESSNNSSTYASGNKPVSPLKQYNLNPNHLSIPAKASKKITNKLMHIKHDK